MRPDLRAPKEEKKASKYPMLEGDPTDRVIQQLGSSTPQGQ